MKLPIARQREEPTEQQQEERWRKAQRKTYAAGLIGFSKFAILETSGRASNSSINEDHGYRIQQSGVNVIGEMRWLGKTESSSTRRGWLQRLLRTWSARHCSIPVGTGVDWSQHPDRDRWSRSEW